MLESVEERGPTYAVGGNVNWFSTVEKRKEFPQKSKNRLAV